MVPMSHSRSENKRSEDRPRSLADKDAINSRLEMLSQPHVAPLTQFVRSLRTEGFGDVPYFDPLDGGTNATSLFLLEKPGSMASSSGFISRNNNDKTAENTFRFMVQAGIDRRTTCLWNTVPGWNGTRKISSAELKAGAACLYRLFALLPDIGVVVLVGRKAQKARYLIQDYGVEILTSFHPSPINYATAPEKWAEIPGEWAKVHKVLA